MTAKLQVMICTHGEGCLDRIVAMNLPQADGVGYLVSAQTAVCTIPQELASREDISIHFTDTHGLSNNRNNALELTTAPYCYICDDDLQLNPLGLSKIIATFEANPHLDILLMRHTGEEKERIYPAEAQPLSVRCKGHYITSFDIALRTEAVKRTGVKFSPLLGIGAPFLTAGEEDLFVHQLIRRHGLAAWFYPICIAHHPGATTGGRAAAGAIRAAGAMLLIKNPLTFVPRAILKALRTRQNGFFKNLWYLLQGGAYALRHKLG